MNYINILAVFFIARVYAAQHTAPARKHLTSHCDNANKNTLIEHFFNIIFAEFYATPPVCVCVQMCPGESTYCYPNGCLKGTSTFRDERDVGLTAQPPQPTLPNKHYMLDDKYDFITDFLEKNYADDSKIGIDQVTPAQDLRPDPFKDKYSLVGKVKRRPNVELTYNIREQVKNSKSEGMDLKQTRWPLKQLRKSKLILESDTPDTGKTNFFANMLDDNNVGAYPPKYFKRDLSKTSDEENDRIAYNSFENMINGTDITNFSLEFLIDSLIKNSFSNNLDASKNTETDKSEVKSNSARDVVSESTTTLTNDVTPIMVLDDNEQRMNKYENKLSNNNLNSTTNVTEMIMYLEKQIDKHNNTSMEMAKRIVEDYEEPISNLTNTVIKDKIVESDSMDNGYSRYDSTISPKYEKTESSTVKEHQVTKKSRQRFIRKLPSSKFN